MSSELTSILSNTFDYVGMEFIDTLLREITLQTKVQSTLLLQLLSAEEYNELSSIYKKDNFHVLQSSSSSPEIVSSPVHQDSTANQFLLIRSCYIDQPSMNSSLKDTMIPLSHLNPSSPYIKTLFNKEPILSLLNQQSETEQQEIERGIYPAYQQFIGLRLDHPHTKAILCVTDCHTMDTCKLNKVTHILEYVKTRCLNELNQLRRQEQLMSARDLAIVDAENKLKFLADMSHEIRTPMNAVIALTDLLLQERSTLNMEQIEHLEVIQTSGSHLLTIINDILDISKLNHDPKFKLESRRFSLRKCLKDTLNMARHQASMSQQNKVVYVLECPPDKDDNVPLPQLISQLENSGVLLRPLLHKKGKTVLPVIWKIDSDVPDHLLGDTMRLTQIMLNLCSNAVKFTKQGGIHIRIKRSTPTPLRTPSTQSKLDKRMTFKERYDAKIETIWNRAMQEKRDRNHASPNNGLVDEEVDYFGEKTVLEISVTDTGIGIPGDRLPKLFKSFSQIDISTARRYGGTGLGLAISSTLVNRMGGCVWVESEEGIGSRFALTLPMTVAPRGRNHSSDSTPLGFTGSPSSPGSTVSDSSSSVHSTLGNTNCVSNDIISPLSSAFFTFTTPTVTSSGSATSSHSGYFPATPVTFNQQQQQQQRPLLPRTSHQHLYTNEPYQQRSEPISIPQANQNTTQDQSFSPMAEDGHPLNPNPSLPPSSELETDQNKRINISGNNHAATNTGNTTARKNYNDLLSPATRNNRVSISKQHYHNRKPQTKEENLAKAHPLRILLAEDNILNQKIAISILKRLGYVDVAIANNGSEVLTLMKTSVFDVIFMDLYMPEMDGLEVTREIIKERTRQKSTTTETTNTPSSPTESNGTLLNSNDVYIIALTASASREDRQICIDAGMNDFISKPFTMTEMKSALKTCANKRKKRRKLTQKVADMDEVIDDVSTIVEDADEEGSASLEAEQHTTDDPMLDIETGAPHPH
ncbi:Hybrid signal transduction histidine kinase J [Choanephora cucurbitarum]|uniref:Hybrid signal transduction histidine kinase J n=1 Tax=Choanephora cucurbitarum TaxID=101091 RepID=A0A1C7NN25_9FUNG|nr:Hybrid signal transduction histidine kinase J [Choanephora cucurbitarum]